MEMVIDDYQGHAAYVTLPLGQRIRSPPADHARLLPFRAAVAVRLPDTLYGAARWAVRNDLDYLPQMGVSEAPAFSVPALGSSGFTGLVNAGYEELPQVVPLDLIVPMRVERIPEPPEDTIMLDKDAVDRGTTSPPTGTGTYLEKRVAEEEPEVTGPLQDGNSINTSPQHRTRATGSRNSSGEPAAKKQKTYDSGNSTDEEYIDALRHSSSRRQQAKPRSTRARKGRGEKPGPKMVWTYEKR